MTNNKLQNKKQRLPAFGIIQTNVFGNTSSKAFGIIQTNVFGNTSSKAFGIIIWRAICRISKNILDAISNVSTGSFAIVKSWRSCNTSYAFGIIEVLISGVLVITVIGATVSVRQTANNQASFTRHQQTAMMLAQEGIEAVRQIRDTNYLAKQKPNRTASFNKRIWSCDLTTLMNVGQEASPPGGFFAACDSTTAESPYTSATNPAINPNNHGDFAVYQAANTKKQTLELGNGMQGGIVFKDDVLGNTILLPAWHLSAPDRVDVGTNPTMSGGAPSVPSPAFQNMDADYCQGVERIFMREGATTNANPKQVLENKRDPGTQTNVNQDNKLAAPSGVTGDCTNSNPAGYVEYKRQFIIDAGGPNKIVGGAYVNDDVPGNLPASWNSATDKITNHEIRVLVRVSWQENNRETGTQDEQGVLLATYLTDWRPSN